jgi:hypothetical protein
MEEGGFILIESNKQLNGGKHIAIASLLHVEQRSSTLFLPTKALVEIGDTLDKELKAMEVEFLNICKILEEIFLSTKDLSIIAIS